MLKQEVKHRIKKTDLQIQSLIFTQTLAHEKGLSNS
jgi:hypothetical protein